MTPIEWLKLHAAGFSELSADERDALADFSLLWSLFEAKALNTNASSDKLLALTHDWASTQKLEFAKFKPDLEYFQQRYYLNSLPTQHFYGLNLRKNDCRALVKEVLAGNNTVSADCVGALLIVVYRLRNNFFHGGKWASFLQGQLLNFQHANNTLMLALEIVGIH